MDITPVKNEQLTPAGEVAAIYGTDQRAAVRDEKKRADRSDFKQKNDTAAMASAADVSPRKGTKTTPEKTALTHFQKKLEKIEKTLREVKGEKDERKGKSLEKKEKRAEKSFVTEKSFTKEALLKKHQELQATIRKELRDGKFSGEKQAGLTVVAKEIEVAGKEFLLSAASDPAGSDASAGTPSAGEINDLIGKWVADEKEVVQEFNALVEDVEGDKPKFNPEQGAVPEAAETVEEVQSQIITVEEVLADQLETLSLSSTATTAEETRAAKEPKRSESTTRATRQNEAKKAAGTDDKTLRETEEILSKIATLKAALAKLDQIKERVYQLQAVKELKEKEFKEVLEVLKAEQDAEETHEAFGGTLVQASSAGEETKEDGKIGAIGGAPEKEGEYVAPAKGDLVQAASDGDVDLSGTDLVMAASGDAMSQEVKNDFKKVKGLIEKLILALQSGNTSVLPDLLILLGLKRKEALINAASVVVKAYQNSEKQQTELTKQFEKLATEENPSTAQLASLNSQQQAVQMFNTSAMGFLREALSQLDSVEETTSSILNLWGQQVRQLARFQA